MHCVIKDTCSFKLVENFISELHIGFITSVHPLVA